MMPKAEYIISRAESVDSTGIAEIEKKCFSVPWSRKQIEEEICRDNVIFLTAKTDSVVAGYISGQMILDEFYISNIAVDEKFRNRHIGSALIEELIKILSEGNCSFATLEVRESNDTARRLYEKYGFKLQGIRRDFYSAPKENACIYTLYFNNEVIHN